MLCIAIVKDIGIGFVIWLPVKVGYMSKYRYMHWRTEGGGRQRVRVALFLGAAILDVPTYIKKNTYGGGTLDHRPGRHFF